MSASASRTGTTPARGTADLSSIWSAWARLGVWVSVPRAPEPVAVEALIVASAAHGREDPRLLECVVGWVARAHGLINGRSLSALASAADPLTAAVLGVVLSWAKLATPKSPGLDAALLRCRRVRRGRPLFAVIENIPTLRARAAATATPLFRRWGLWHDDEAVHLDAIQDVSRMIREVPELGIRALLGPTLDADILTRVMQQPATACVLSGALGVSYAATHEAMDRLVNRGLCARERAGAGQLLVPLRAVHDVVAALRNGSPLTRPIPSSRQGVQRTAGLVRSLRRRR